MGGRQARYEAVIGLEVHVHLRTQSKLFSPAPVLYGELPNHAVHPIDLGLPGVLPVVNGEAVPLAVRAALALHCQVHERCVFARKNYFYPDLPKGYQISQFEAPLATGGWLEVPAGEGGEGVRRVGITRVHMEEDAGKSIHDEKVAGREGSHVDLNRAGVPLIEIVSEPDLRSPEEASAYLRALREIVRYAGVSDADMEKGQLRCDVNLSLRRRGETRLGTRTECKNLNSFRFVEEAIRSEMRRQAKVLDAGGEVVQATLHYDPERRSTRVMRVKENADDYRYFPDPDLIPLELSREEVERIRASLPELPEARRARLREEHALSESEAGVLTSSRELADFFEAACQAHGDAKTLANWVLRDLLAAVKAEGLELDRIRLAPEAFAALVGLVEESRVTARQARELLPELLREGGDPAELARARGLEVVRDAGRLEAVVAEVLAAHPEAVSNHRAGDEKVVNFLMGQVMKQTRGQADPGALREILVRRLKE
ncbi:MAG: Asp-tRNA(Asn)/Glu-tRNA(Gln) amidotransferase subunit GatB [Myxococcota bacterium]